jgi:hypothetical protein
MNPEVPHCFLGRAGAVLKSRNFFPLQVCQPLEISAMWIFAQNLKR